MPEEDQRDLQVHPDQLQARTYDYTGEEACDENMRITLRSIAAAADVEGDYGFAAVKVTSLGPPELLRHVSQVCVDIGETFRKYASVEAPPVVGSALRDVGPMHTAVLTKKAFLKAMAASDVPIGEKEAAEIYSEIDVDGNGKIDYLVRTYWRRRTAHSISHAFHLTGVARLHQPPRSWNSRCRQDRNPHFAPWRPDRAGPRHEAALCEHA